MVENSLHEGVKHWYAEPGDLIEENVEDYLIDIVRGEQLIEIQTRNFSAIKKKLAKLVHNHRVHLVHPVSQRRKQGKSVPASISEEGTSRGRFHRVGLHARPHSAA
jgi:hypothetical protein